MENMIFIEGNVPSSKNSRVTVRATGRSFPSKNVQKYTKETKEQYTKYKDQFLKLMEEKEAPVMIGFHFVRDSRRRWDFHNMVQLPLDLMTKYEWIEDDCTKFIYPMPFKIEDQLESLNKDQPGVYITVL